MELVAYAKHNIVIIRIFTNKHTKKYTDFN